MELLIHLGSVALLAIVVEGACRLGRYRPALCHALWLVVLIKVAVPPRPGLDRRGIRFRESAAQERRLWMIMKGNGAYSVPWIYAAGVIALMVIATPASFAMAENAKPGAEALVAAAGETPISDGWQLDLTPTQKAQKSLTSIVNVEFQDLHIKDATEFIQDSFDINMVIDFRVVQSPFAKQVRPYSTEPVCGVGVPSIKPSPVETSKLTSPFPHDYTTDGMIATINAKIVP